MNLDELRPILYGYRKQLEAAWSPATAHEDYEGKQGDPTGQCGVTSAWLQRRLAEDHGIATTYLTGVFHAVDDESAAIHCWLEIDGYESTVVDLTADQFPRLRHAPVVCRTYPDLFRDGIDYQAEQWMNADELLADPVQARLSILTKAIS